jgi:hypothetical protein
MWLEVAIQAKAHGLTVIAVTALAHSVICLEHPRKTAIRVADLSWITMPLRDAMPAVDGLITRSALPGRWRGGHPVGRGGRSSKDRQASSPRSSQRQLADGWSLVHAVKKEGLRRDIREKPLEYLNKIIELLEEVRRTQGMRSNAAGRRRHRRRPAGVCIRGPRQHAGAGIVLRAGGLVPVNPILPPD